MEDSRGQVSGSAAAVYEQFFVPALFGEWAPRVADAVAPEPGQTVLDVACGTGVLTREVAKRVAPGGRAVGLDPNEGMLEMARTLAGGIDWRHGVAEELPFAPGELDAVVSQFGLMFFDDPVRALGEMWRVLRPGGRLAVAVWGRLADTPGYASMVALLTRLFGPDVANELVVPYRLGDPAALLSLFESAGIADARLATLPGTARFPSIADWVHTDIRGWTLADAIDDDQFALLAREAEVELAPYAAGGSVAFASPAHIVSARKR